MSTDTITKDDREGLNFEKFLENAKADHDNPKEFGHSIKMTIMTIIVVLLAGASELRVLDDEDDVLGEGGTSGEDAIKAFLRDVFKAYTNLAQTKEQNGPVSRESRAPSFRADSYLLSVLCRRHSRE